MWFAVSKSQEQQSCRTVVVVISSSPLPPRMQFCSQFSSLPSPPLPFFLPRAHASAAAVANLPSATTRGPEARPFSSHRLLACPLAQQRTGKGVRGRGSHPACLQIQCLSPMGNCASAVDAFVQRGGRSSATPGESNHQQARAISLLFLLKASIFGLLAFLIGMQQVILFNCLVNSVIL